MLGVSFAWLRNRGSRGAEQAVGILSTGLSTFVYSAGYFAVAIQLATIAVLVQKDFGISTSDFGAIEAQIAHAISVVCMLPLLGPIALLTSKAEDPRRNPRLFLLHMVVALSFYPFSPDVYNSSVPRRLEPDRKSVFRRWPRWSA